mmetsp:Transcript_26796/g.46784  ORF Transcript_26796/g.46784 Transcript_26796/m.46784 type:complete len:1092 (-) Transcript_26796:41-3316(-)
MASPAGFSDEFGDVTERSSSEQESSVQNGRTSQRSMLADSFLRPLDKRSDKSLISPLPNLFRATFENAHRQSPGEQWLQLRIAAFDAGKKQKRKEVLQEFLEYMQNSSAASMEELFSNQAHLFFIRLTSWFAVTLPMFYELALQLKVFMAFIELREQVFIRAFFESGAVVTLMNTLSVNFDATDEVRCLAILCLHKLASNGRYYKEMLCAEGLVQCVVDCVSDGLQWETIKCAGRLLCEVFRANPRYQVEVLDQLQGLMTHKLPLAQRVGTQAIISLLMGERHSIPSLLQSPERHDHLISRALPLLDSRDLRVGADAYCLVCRLVCAFGCDNQLFEYARQQLKLGAESIEDWLQLELEAQTHQAESESRPQSSTNTSQKGWLSISSETLYKNISQAMAQHPPTEGSRDSDMISFLSQKNVHFGEAFRKEAGHILKWALLLFLVKRNKNLCNELVKHGLTEALLMCLLDVARPVQQAAALAELHRLQLLSNQAKRIVETVLGKGEITRAMTLFQFMQAARPGDLERARCRLRNMRMSGDSMQKRTSAGQTTFKASEFSLKQRLIEEEMSSSINVSSAAPGTFLTGDPDQSEEAASSKPKTPMDKTDDPHEVHRSGRDKFDVQRVPMLKTGTSHPDEDHSGIEMGTVIEIPFCGSLSSLLFDPLDITADEESPLIQELRTIEGFGTFHRFSPSVNKRRGADAAPSPASPATTMSKRRQALEGLPKKASHRLDAEHKRELVLRGLPPPGVEARRKPKPITGLPGRPLSAASESTMISLRTGHLEELSPGLRIDHSNLDLGARVQRRRGKLTEDHSMSLAETSVGQDWPQELSHEMPSTDTFVPLHSVSMDTLVAQNSVTTMQSDSLDLQCGICGLDAGPSHVCSAHCLHPSHLGPIQEGPPGRVAQRAPIAAVIEVPRKQLDGDQGDATPPVQKRILQVAPAPHHKCLAFDASDIERDREKVLEESLELMHPRTQRLFKDIREAGSFSRKNAGPNVGRWQFSKLGMDSPISGPWSARERRKVGPEDGAVSVAGTEESSRAPSRLAAGLTMSGDPLPSGEAVIPDFSAFSAFDPQDAESKLKSFFPASARAANEA